MPVGHCLFKRTHRATPKLRTTTKEYHATSPSFARLLWRAWPPLPRPWPHGLPLCAHGSARTRGMRDETRAESRTRTRRAFGPGVRGATACWRFDCAYVASGLPLRDYSKCRAKRKAPSHALHGTGGVVRKGNVSVFWRCCAHSSLTATRAHDREKPLAALFLDVLEERAISLAGVCVFPVAWCLWSL